MGMKHAEEQIALQAIEFWSTVCETETEYAWEAAEVGPLVVDIQTCVLKFYPPGP